MDHKKGLGVLNVYSDMEGTVLNICWDTSFILTTLATAISYKMYSHCKVITLLPRGEFSCSVVFYID